MTRKAHGRCDSCNLIFRWSGRPLVRDALCPQCMRRLARTAVALVKHIEIVDEKPEEYTGEPSRGRSAP